MSQSLGASEARTELYRKYNEGVLELATPRLAKNLAVQPALLVGGLGGVGIMLE